MKLYKFRKIDNDGKYYKGLLDLINTKTLEAKHFSEFNDINECKFNLRFDVDIIDILNNKFGNEIVRPLLPMFTCIKNYVISLNKLTFLDMSNDFLNSELKKVIICIIDLYLFKIQNRTNILCMSKSWNKPKMWEDYNKHNGVCVEFEFDKSQDLLMNDINYENKIPIINHNDLCNLNIFKNKLLYTKSKEYKYENEFRICTYENTILMNDVTKIYIGKLVDKEIETNLIKDIQQINPNIEIHRVDLSNTHYKMVSKKCIASNSLLN